MSVFTLDGFVAACGATANDLPADPDGFTARLVAEPRGWLARGNRRGALAVSQIGGVGMPAAMEATGT